MSSSSPAALALSKLRAKHLTALEQITTLTTALALLKTQHQSNASLQTAAHTRQQQWEEEKAVFSDIQKKLRERLLLSESTTLDVTEHNNRLTAECAQLTERLHSQKNAVTQSTDEVATLRARLSTIQTKHATEVEVLTMASAADLAALAEWRRKYQTLELEQSGQTTTSRELATTVNKLNKEIKRLVDQRKRDQALLSEKAMQLQQVSQQQLKEMATTVHNLTVELNQSKKDNERLKRNNNTEGNELREAKRTIQTLGEQVNEGKNRYDFMTKALEQAKSEWEALSQENAVLKQRLEQLEKIASGGSKFAKFVAIKEENAKLTSHNHRLQKAHRHLRKQTKNTKFGGLPGQRQRQPGVPPRRPETTLM